MIVDDTNLAAARQATVEFLDASEYDYRVLLDESTSANGHPTWWNGLLILQRTGPKRRGAPVSIMSPSKETDDQSEAAKESDLNGSGAALKETGAALVSIVVYNNQGDAQRLESAIEACVQQSWPRIELLVADDSNSPGFTNLVNKFGSRVASVIGSTSKSSALAGAAETTTGTFLAVVDVDDPPLQSEALETAIASHRRFMAVTPHSLGMSK